MSGLAAHLPGGRANIEGQLWSSSEIWWGAPMSDVEKLRRNMDALSEAIRTNWLDLASKPLKVSERVAIRRAVAALQAELAKLIQRLDGSMRS